MENNKEGFFAELKDQVEGYVKDKLLLFKIESTEKVAGIASSLYILLPVAVLSFVILLLITFLAGYYLSQWLNSYAAGFGLLIGIYILLLILLLYMHKKYLKHFVANKIVNTIFEEKDDHHGL